MQFNHRFLLVLKESAAPPCICVIWQRNYGKHHATHLLAMKADQISARNNEFIRFPMSTKYVN
jgi:hypothetical protein